MQLKPKKKKVSQTRFTLNDHFEIIKHNENIKAWKLAKPHKAPTLHHLESEVKYPLLNLVSYMNMNNLEYAADSYDIDTELDCEGVQIEIQSSDSNNEYEIQLTPLFKDSKSPKTKNFARGSSYQLIDGVIKQFQETDDFSKSDILSSLKSIRNKLSFREDQLRNSNRDYHLLLENNHQACLMIDQFFSVIKYNTNALDLIKSVFGVELQKNLVITDILTEDDSRILRNRVLEVIQGNTSHDELEITFNSANCQNKTYRFSIHAAKRHQKNLKAVTIVIEDVTSDLLSDKIRSINIQLMKIAMNPLKTGEEISTFFIQEFEKVFEGTMCSILLIRNKRFANLSSPSLPKDYIDLVTTINITENTGSCGRAAHSQEVAISNDLLNDKKWIGLKEELKKNDLRSCISFPIVNSSGHTVAVLGVYRKEIHEPTVEEIEIGKQFTELLAIISEMQRYKKKHEDLLNSISDGFFSLDKEFNIAYWNKTAEEITGINVEKALGSNLWEVFPKIQHKSKSKFIELINTKKNGSMTSYFPLLKMWLELIIYPKGEGFISVFFRDVSVRIQKEQQLIEAKDRIESVMNTANDAIYELDLKANEITWSKGYKDLFGHDLKINKVNVESRFEHVHPDQREKLLNKFKKVLSDRKKEKWNAEYSFKRSNGSYAHVMERGRIIRNENGKATKLIGAITDISYHKEYEESLIYLNEVLRNRAVQLQQNNEELEQFAYLASHDLQEPLRTITNFIHQLEKKYGNHIDDKGKRYIQFVVEGAERMRRLITDILDYSKIGKDISKPSEVDMNDLIASIRKTMKQQIEENNAVFNIGNLPIVKASEAHLYHIFSNLISNAIKYRKNELNPEISIDYQNINSYHMFSVKDNGIGINPEFDDKIFEIFQRLHNDSHYTGTGIGLAMVKKSVEELEGEIDVEHHDNGTTFKVKIPNYKQHKRLTTETTLHSSK